MKKYIMKTLTTILLILMGLSFTSCICPKSKKYTIRQDGNTYYTNVITPTKDGCITFKLNDENPVIICGNYTIEEDKDWKPELPKARKNR